MNRNENLNIEELLLADAARMPEPPPLEMRQLRPAIARACAAARLRRKRRRETALFVAAMIPTLLAVGTACRAALDGRWQEAAPLLIAFGLLSFFALFTLPLLEKFLPRRETIRSVNPC